MDNEVFPSTRWSVVRRAGGQLGSEASAAFSELCGAYWYPLFAYLRRSGKSQDEAGDLVQGLFVSLLERGTLESIKEEGARFRGWLMGALRNHSVDVVRKERAIKRGGDVYHFSIDAQEAEDRYAREPASDEDPAALFERAWANEVLAQGLLRVEAEYRDSNRGLQYDLLRPTLVGEEIDRIGAARALDMTPVALRVALHRLRTRYRDQLVQEVRDTIGDDQDLGSEVSELLRALGVEENGDGR